MKNSYKLIIVTTSSGLTCINSNFRSGRVKFFIASPIFVMLSKFLRESHVVLVICFSLEHFVRKVYMRKMYQFYLVAQICGDSNGGHGPAFGSLSRTDIELVCGEFSAHCTEIARVCRAWATDSSYSVSKWCQNSVILKCGIMETSETPVWRWGQTF